eukprot:3468186-Pyramimonas_sp.AAC.1
MLPLLLLLSMFLLVLLLPNPGPAVFPARPPAHRLPPHPMHAAPHSVIAHDTAEYAWGFQGRYSTHRRNWKGCVGGGLLSEVARAHLA